MAILLTSCAGPANLPVMSEKTAATDDRLLIGPGLKRVLRLRLMTQQELADLLEVSPMTVNRWVRDRKAPHVRNLRRIAKALSVDPEELLR